MSSVPSGLLNVNGRAAVADERLEALATELLEDASLADERLEALATELLEDASLKFQKEVANPSVVISLVD